MIDWKHAFDVISNALSVISTAGSTPGINLIPYVSTVASAASLINTGLKTGVKVLPYVAAIKETFANGLPTEEKRVALDAKLVELRAIVQAPLPPPEDGEKE